jgi:hypothetical protein
MFTTKNTYQYIIVKTSTYTYVNLTLPTKLNFLTILLNQDFDDVMLSLLDRAKYTVEWLTEIP